MPTVPLPTTGRYRLLADAVEIGYNFFDTVLSAMAPPITPMTTRNWWAKALKPFRNDIVIATKFGITIDERTHQLITDSKPESVRKAVEGSLRLLQTDRIDLYYQHRIDPEVEPETVAEVMSDLMREGKILNWGISEATEEYLRRAHAVCPVTAIQNRYSMIPVE